MRNSLHIASDGLLRRGGRPTLGMASRGLLFTPIPEQGGHRGVSYASPRMIMSPDELRRMLEPKRPEIDHAAEDNDFLLFMN